MKSSSNPADRARKSYSTVLQRLQTPGTQTAIAAAMGVSESTISRMKTEQLEHLCLLLAHAGLKIVSIEKVCVDAEMYAALSCIASRAMADEETSRKLVWEDE